jgi:hypothetical protein
MALPRKLFTILFQIWSPLTCVSKLNLVPGHTISPLPQKSAAKLEPTRTADMRSFARGLFREYPLKAETSIPHCQLPNISWVFNRSILLGLNPSSIPSHLDLHTPRVG